MVYKLMSYIYLNNTIPPIQYLPLHLLFVSIVFCEKCNSVPVEDKTL